MHTACPHCGAVLDIDARYAGQVVSCSACKQQFRAPDQSSAAGTPGGALQAGVVSSAGPGSEPLPRIVMGHTPAPAALLLSSALETLLDFGFRKQGSASLAKVLYGVTLVSIAIWLVIGFFENAYYFVERLRYLSEFKDIMRVSYNFGLWEVMRFLFGTLTVLWTRLACEVAPALLRLTDLASAIERNTKPASGR